MLTIKEFKGLGVIYVAGDVFDGYPLTVSGAKVLNDMEGWDFKRTTSFFSWRPLITLPDNPKFKYEKKRVDFRLCWRPLLDQSTPKPINDAALKPSDGELVFTQEMKDNGALPPVGSWFIDSAYRSDINFLALLHHNKKVVYRDDSGDYIGCPQHDCNPICNKTDKEKVVDEMI